jgi:hypothetical protein
MDLNKVINKWEQIRINLHNEGNYKKMCHIDPSPWFNEAETIATILIDLRALAKTSNENSALPIPDVSKSFYCQRQIEGNRKCKKQCDHCKDYYKPLEQ